MPQGGGARKRMKGYLRPFVSRIRFRLTALDRAIYRWVGARVSARPSGVANPHAIHFLVGSLGLGGTQRQMLALIHGLVARGFRCRVWVIDETPGPLALEIPSGVVVEGVFSGPGLTNKVLRCAYRLTGPAALALPAFALARKLRRDRPRVLQCLLDATNVIGAQGGRLAGVPIVALGLRSLHPGTRPWAKASPWSDVYDVLDLRAFDVLIANSEAGRESFLSFLSSVPKERIAVVRNCVVPPARSAVPARRPLSPPMILWLARIAPEKRPDLFVRLLSRLKERDIQFQAWIAGEGEQLLETKSLVAAEGLSSRISFLGVVAAVGNLLDAASLLVLCSDVEGLPNVVLEAQHAGCPVVATAVGGVPELIADGHTGFLVPAGDLEALAARVSTLLENPELAEPIAAAAKLSARQRFSVDRLVEDTLAAYSRAGKSRMGCVD